MPEVPQSVRDKVLLDHAEETLNRALETLRMITPEGWEKAYVVALMRGGGDGRWNSYDVSLLQDARLLAMRGGPRFRNPDYVRQPAVRN